MVSKRKAYQRYAAGGAVRAEATPAEVEAPAAVPAAEVEDTSASNAFQDQIDAQRRAEQVRHEPLTVERQIDSMSMPDHIKTWMKAHPEYVTDARKNSLIQKLHWDIVEDEGHEPYSKPYIASMERHLGMDPPEIRELEAAFERGDNAAQAEITSRISKANTALARGDDADSGRGRIVSAPVSREWSGSSYGDRPDKVVMTPEMKSAAAISGISETEYAKQVLRLREAKKNGDYQGRP